MTHLFSSFGPSFILWMVALVFTCPAFAEDWPRFLGPRMDNTSMETNLLERLPTGGPRLVWEKSIGAGYSAPSVRDGKVVYHHREQNEEVVEMVAADTGKLIWRHAYPCTFSDPYGYNNGPRCSPVLTTNRCYTYGANGKLVCLDQAKGALLWQRETAKDWNIPQAFFGVGSTPLLESNRLFVMVGGMPNSGVVALDAETGKTIWENVGEKNWQGQPKYGYRSTPPALWAEEDKQASYSSPIAATINGRRQILCLTRQGLVSLDPANGQVNFCHYFRSQVRESVNAMTPVVKDDLIFISSSYYRLGSVLLRVKPDGKAVEEVWRSTALEVHWNTPVLMNGHLYAFSGRNEYEARFRCVELLTGKLQWDLDERWNKSDGKQPAVYGRGSAILADEKLIVLGECGLMGLFRVTPEKAEEISRWQVPQLHYPCWAAPVLSDRRLYLRSENRLLCLDFSALTSLR